jgi:hypothetical protein
MQALDGCQRDAVGVDGGDGCFLGAQSKSGVKILGHRADVLDTSLLAFEAPLFDRQNRDALENCGTVDRFDIGLGVAIGIGRDGAGREDVADDVLVVPMPTLPPKSWRMTLPVSMAERMYQSPVVP